MGLNDMQEYYKKVVEHIREEMAESYGRGWTGTDYSGVGLLKTVMTKAMMMMMMVKLMEAKKITMISATERPGK